MHLPDGCIYDVSLVVDSLLCTCTVEAVSGSQGSPEVDRAAKDGCAEEAI